MSVNDSDPKSWHIGLGTIQRCNQLTTATSRTGLYDSGVFTALEVYNSGRTECLQLRVLREGSNCLVLCLDLTWQSQATHTTFTTVPITIGLVLPVNHRRLGTRNPGRH
jgi:hypothetical protein